MTRQEVNDLYMLRLLIEPYAAARAAESMTDESLGILSDMEQEMARIQTGSGVAYARFAEADSTLHHLVATGSGNRLIADTIERLHVHLHIFCFLYSTNAPEQAAAEHKRLIEALLARDPTAAEAAMRDHLERSRVRMDQALSTIEQHVDPEDEEPAPSAA
jgi:DNA-binding GntR family transcriptional regulator